MARSQATALSSTITAVALCALSVAICQDDLNNLSNWRDVVAWLSETVSTPSWSLASALGLAAVAAATCLALHAWLATPNVYLVDFTVRRPDDSWKTTRISSALRAASKNFTRTALDFQFKMLWSSALGNETYIPPWMTVADATESEDTSIEKARLEFDMVVVEAIRDLFNKTGITADQIGVLVVNCSLFCPTPSLCAHVMNHFNMSSDTMTYNLGGMGCSASPIAVDLARQVLTLRANTYALVVSTENITQNMYKGTDRSMLIPNVLFRAGGAAILLTNKRSEARRSKYQLLHTVRTTLSADATAYQCCWEMEDAEGFRGVRLSKELIKVAGGALRVNLTRLAPKVLPVHEQLRYVVTMFARRYLGIRSLAPYTPNFQSAANHICIHTGGRGVIDAIQKELCLTNDYVEPSRAALYRYGNVSSSSCWYVLAYIESQRGVKRGDRVLQLAFGSGFKCNSAVWVANRSFQTPHHAWEGFNLAEMYADLATLDGELKQVMQMLDARDAQREQIASKHA